MKTERRRSQVCAAPPEDDGFHPSPNSAPGLSLDRASPFGMFQTDTAGYCNVVNDQWCSMSGLTRATALGRKWTDAVHPGDRDRVSLLWLETSRRSIAQAFSCRLLRPDGHVIWIGAQVAPTWDRTGVLNGYAGSVVEIGARTADEEDQRADEARLRALAAASTSAIWTIDAAGDLIDAPVARWPFLTDLPAEELAAEWLAAVHPDDRAVGNAVWWTGVADGRSFEFEQRVRQRDGSYRHFAVRAVPVRDEAGSVREWVGADIDITERKRSEAALREREHFLRQVTATVPGVIYVYDLQAHRNVYANRQLADVLGYSPEEAQAMGERFLPTVIHPDDWAATPDHLARLAALADGEMLTREYRIRHKDGSWRWFHGRETIFGRNEKGMPTQVLGSALDITERRTAEESAQVSRRYVEQILEVSPSVVYVRDLATRRNLFVNRSPAAILGYAPDQISAMAEQFDPADMHPDDRAALDERDRRLAGLVDGDTLTAEFRMRHESGAWRWFLSREAVFRRDANGAVVEIIGTSTDITARKEAEERLLSSERELRLMADAMPQVVWIADRDGIVRYYNNRVSQFASVTRSNAGTWDWRPVIHPDDLPGTIAAWERAVREKAPYSHEHRIEMATGGYRWHLSRATPVLDAHGELETWYGTATDIHDLKAAEVALRANEERLRLGIEVAGFALLEVDYDADVVHLTPEAARLYGLGEDAATVPRARMHATFHPDDRNALLRRIAVSPSTEAFEAYTADYRILTPNGELRWLSVRKQVVVDRSGPLTKPVRAILAALDITERKRAEDALRRQNEVTRTIAENATLALFQMDERQHCTFMNPAAARMTGYSIDEVQGAPLHDFVHHTRPDGSHYPLAECPIDRALPERARMQGEEVFVHKDGHFYPVVFTASPILHDGRPVGTVIEVEDITERKRAEENRQALLDALAHDLRNPLTTIKMQTELLQRRIEVRGLLDSVELTDRLAGLEGLADRMTILLDELDDLAHLTSAVGSLLDRRPIDLVALVRERLEGSPIVGGLPTLEFDTAETDLIGEWDEVQIRRVIDNLLSNAVKYSPAGGAVRVRLYRDGASAVLQVEDHGIGIPAADQPLVFTFRHRGGNVGATPGSGAGLTSAKQIVEHHGGTIAFASDEGVGSVFTVRLPLERRQTNRTIGTSPG
jgi:PAS domain S-box-containing protein